MTASKINNKPEIVTPVKKTNETNEQPEKKSPDITFAKTDDRLILAARKAEKRSEHMTIHPTPSQKEKILRVASELNLSVNETILILFEYAAEHVVIGAPDKNDRTLTTSIR